MQECEFHKIGNYTCHNPVYANVTIEGSKGNVTLGLCEPHLNQLTGAVPTTESQTARQQRERGQA